MRYFSIFLLKEGWDFSNALKDNDLLEPETTTQDLPEGSTLYVLDTKPKEAWWKFYFGITRPLKQVAKGALLFLPVEDRVFCLTFGHTYHYLQDDSFEYDFGLRITLNSIDPEKIRTTDILEPGIAKRQRIQSPIDSELTFFDFDHDSTIVKNLAGKVKDQYKDLFKKVTGASSLRIGSKAAAEDLVDLCKNLLDLYKNEDYKKLFPDIHNITPVKDPSILESLNRQLIIDFQGEEPTVVLTIPAIFEENEIYEIAFSPGRSDYYDDVKIGYYREFLSSQNLKVTDIKLLKKHRMLICDENHDVKKGFSVFKSLLYDVELENNHYHLCEGQWYQIESNFIKRLSMAIDKYFEKSQLIPFNHKDEEAYNQAVAANDSHYICLDRTNIAPAGSKQIEPCDLFRIENGRPVFYHVKRSTRSSTLSHLFNQGLNSIELLKSEPEALSAFIQLIKSSLGRESASIAIEKAKIVFEIITHKPAKQKSKNLPLFSKINLHRTIKAMRRMGVDVAICYINAKSDGK